MVFLFFIHSNRFLIVILTYNFPTKIRFGAGAVEELADYLKDNNLSKPLIVTDPVVAQLPFLKRIAENLNTKGISVEVFSDIHKNPVKSTSSAPATPNFRSLPEVSA